jgi:hypothetical protein
MLAGDREYAMFEHWRRYSWVLPEYRYSRTEDLLLGLNDYVIVPAERRAAELQSRK